MVNRRSVCVVLSLLFVAFGLHAGERVYTFDDMEAWEVVTGDWRVEKGEFYAGGSNDTTIGLAVLKKDEGITVDDLESVSVKAQDLGTGAWQNVFLVFGYEEDVVEYYLAGAFVGGRQKWAFDPIDPAIHKRGGALGEAADALGPKKWYELKLVFDGDTATLFGAELGDKLEERVSYTFGGGLPAGRVGLGVSNSEAKYDDFTLTGPGVSPLAVEPRGKLATSWAALKRR